MFWSIVVVVAALAAAVLARPLLRRWAEAEAETTDRGLQIYRDQLAEVERDRESDLVSEAEADAARLEVERRILKAIPAASNASPPPTPGARLFLAGLVVGAIPAGTLALYLALGTPGSIGTNVRMPPAAFAIDDSASADALVAQARELLAADRSADAAEVLAQAAMRSPHRPDIRSLLGETRVAAADGVVGDAARTAFREALALDPSDPRARFYLGLARAQDGDLRGALDDWLAFEADSPPNAPWRTMLAERMSALAKELGVDLEAQRTQVAAMPRAAPSVVSRPPAAAASEPRGPTAADMAAASQMAPADRQQMIRGMVDGLAARLEDNPADIEGWRRLARARRVLGEDAAATEALRRAADAAPGRIDVQMDYARALQPQGSMPETLSPEFVRVMRRVLDLDPVHAEGLFFVGEAEAKAGNSGVARMLWGRLLARIDPKEPLHNAIVERLKKLDLAR
jgi:cytochrome c-type biogenesis protein CcmH